MATRLARGDPGADAIEQALQQFVNQSPWDPTPVRRRLAERMTTAIQCQDRAVRGPGAAAGARYRQRRSPLRQLVLDVGEPAATTIAWREGADGQPLASRFVALRVRPAGIRLRRAARGGQLPVRWLLAGWAGACPLCQRRLPRSTAWSHPSATPT